MKKTIFLFISMVFIATQPIYNSGNYSLGTNLIANPQFQLPPLNGNTYFYNNANITGWACHATCETKNPIPNCPIYGKDCSYLAITQLLDLDSFGVFDNISQVVTIVNATEYLLTAEWITPLNNAVRKSFRIELNSTAVLDQTIINSSIQILSNKTALVLPAGDLSIKIHMYGTVPDYEGILLVGVTLQQVIPLQIPQSNQKIQTNASNSSIVPATKNNATSNQANTTNSSTAKNTSNNSTNGQTNLNTSQNNQQTTHNTNGSNNQSNSSSYHSANQTNSTTNSA